MLRVSREDGSTRGSPARRSCRRWPNGSCATSSIPLRRDALRVAAFVRHTTEAVLAAVLGADAAPSLFDWMRRLTFMAAAPAGLVPHELVREVLVADALWRDPGHADRCRPQGVRAPVRGRCLQYRHATTALPGRGPLRDAPFAAQAPFFDWKALGQHRVEAARSDDFELLAAIVPAMRARQRFAGFATGGSGSVKASCCFAMPPTAAMASC